MLATENFLGFAGTETYTLTVAREFQRLGHDAMIFSPNRGAMADLARGQGVAVLSAAQLPPACDLVLASDAATCHELTGRYLDAPVVFVVHSADFMLQAPPQLLDRCAATVVMNDRVRRAVEARGWHAPVVRLRQPIDLLRYCDLGPPRSSARRALATSNYVDGPRAALIEQACRANGLELEWIGTTSSPSAAPELSIASADLVIGLGRGALEAMAGGRAAYVYGAVGGDGWVTPDRYPAMEADGFAGTASRELVIDAERMTADLGNWTGQMGEVGRDLASAHHGARDHAVALVELAHDLGPGSPTPLSPTAELAHLIRLQWESESRAVTSLREAARLRSMLGDLELEMNALRTYLSTVESDLALVQRTRRYRLGSRIAAPLDWLRDGGGVPRRSAVEGPDERPDD